METNYKPGDRVRMLPPYVGSGRYGTDEHTGHVHTVLKALPGSADYKLARGIFAATPSPSEWTVIAHASRLERTN